MIDDADDRGVVGGGFPAERLTCRASLDHHEHFLADARANRIDRENRRAFRFVVQAEHLYEQQELGASVRYTHNLQKDRWMDLYFYPAGILSNERLVEVMESTLEGMRLSAGYSDADIDPIKPVVFTQGSGAQKQKITAYTTSMRLVREGQTYHSAMVMLVSDLYFIKGRFSVEEKSLSRQETQKQLEKFVAAVVRESTLHSTGGCWAPPPIVQKAVLTEGAPGQLASTSKDGTLSAIAYADRIEVLDAQSSEAVVMQFLSMPMTGRLVPGCGPIEDMNPEVPKGMREIRLEFGVPSVTSTGLEVAHPNVGRQLMADAFVQMIPDLKYAETSHRGYLALTLTPAAATADWVFVSSVLENSFSAFAGPTLRMLPGSANRALAPA